MSNYSRGEWEEEFDDVFFVESDSNYFEVNMNIWNSYMWTAEWRIIWKKIIAVNFFTQLLQLRKESLEKIQALYGIQTLDLYDTGAALYQWN